MTLTRKPFLILIAGGSGSGKTTVAEEIIKNLPTDVSGISICQDRYYLANNSKKSKDVHTFNYDHPNAFDWKLMIKQLKDIMQNKPIRLPIYDYLHHERKSEKELFKPADVIIFEGIHALRDEELNKLSELKIFVDTPKDESFIRRLERDTKVRGRQLDDVIFQWRNTVRPMYDAFIEPLKAKADIIIPWNEYQRKAVEIIRHGLINLKKQNELKTKK